MMKWVSGRLWAESLSILLMLVGFVLFAICAVCSASQGNPETSPSPDFDQYLLVQAMAIVFNGVSFLGCICWMSKKYMVKVDQISEATPSMIKTLEALTESIKEHYQSLEGHGTRLTQIETVHHIRGCNSADGKPHWTVDGIGSADSIPVIASQRSGENKK